MTAPLTGEQHAAIRALLGDVKPATNDLIASLAESVRDRRTHDHPKHEDFFCENLSGWAGDRMAVVLSRLIDAEAELDRLRADRDQFADRVDTLTAVAKSNQRAHRILAEECANQERALGTVHAQLATIQAQAVEQNQRAHRAEATIQRIDDLREQWADHCLHPQTRELLDQLSAALDGPADGPPTPAADAE